jgi:creatinine amidohydrolase
MKRPSPIRLAPALALAGLVAAAAFAGSAAGAEKPPARNAAAEPATNPLWHETKIKNYLPDMTWPEVQDLLTRTDMVIIPVAALEQHSLQGPIGTDFLNSTEEAKLIAQRTDVLVAPILLPGNSPYHMEFPGTITLSTQTIQQVYFEAAQSLIHHGFKRFLILTGHAGNTATAAFIVDRINQETPGIAVELNEAAQPYYPRRPPPPAGSPPAPPPAFDQHAGVAETSLSLYLTPGLVNLAAARAAKLTLPPHLQAMEPKAQAGDATARLVFQAEALKAKSTGKHSSTREITDTGSWSELDPKTATAAMGREYAEHFVDASVQFIEAWKKLRPLGAP